MSRFLNESLSQLVPYTPGEQPRGMDKLIKLNTNENPFPPAPAVRGVLDGTSIDDLRRYNDPSCKGLVEAMAKAYGLRVEETFVANGSDEILALIMMAHCEGGVAFADITYGFYGVLTDLFAIPKEIVPLREDYTINVMDYQHITTPIFIANPNAPTGIPIPLSHIEVLLQQNSNRLVVVDEAYVDFGAESALPLIEQYDNLLVTGTFSKSRSLAGARLGYALGNEQLIADLNRVKYSFHPYNVNTLTQRIGVAALEDVDYFNRCCQQVMATRQTTVERLEKLGCQVLPSCANFIFVNGVKVSGKDYYKKLRDANILVRYFDANRLRDFVRVSIGTAEEMDKFLAVTAEILK